MNKQKLREEIKEILRVYHYESDTENMSKDVVTSLENIDMDTDEHINLLLEHPTPCFDVLVRLYIGYIRRIFVNSRKTTMKINLMLPELF